MSQSSQHTIQIRDANAFVLKQKKEQAKGDVQNKYTSFSTLDSCNHLPTISLQLPVPCHKLSSVASLSDSPKETLEGLSVFLVCLCCLTELSRHPSWPLLSNHLIYLQTWTSECLLSSGNMSESRVSKSESEAGQQETPHSPVPSSPMES